MQYTLNIMNYTCSYARDTLKSVNIMNLICSRERDVFKSIKKFLARNFFLIFKVKTSFLIFSASCGPIPLKPHAE